MSEQISITTHEITFRMGGRPDTRINVENADRADLAVTVSADNVVIRIADMTAMAALLYVWAIGDHAAAALPVVTDEYRTFSRRIGGNRHIHAIELNGKSPSAVAFIPASDFDVAHVRVQFGEIVWEVEDITAYAALLQTFGNARKVFIEALKAATAVSA